MKKFDLTALEINCETSKRWQEITGLLSELLDIAYAIILKYDGDYFEVAAINRDMDNFRPGEKRKLPNSYFEKIVGLNRKVTGTSTDKEFTGNLSDPCSFLGFPLNLPNGSVFGTLIILDKKESEFPELHEKLMLQFKYQIEQDLALLLKARTRKTEIDVEGKLILKSRHEAENSEKKYISIFNSTGTANAIFNPDGTLQLQNRMSVEYLGRNGIGLSVYELFGKKTGQIIFERIQTVVETGNPSTFETLFNLPTGEMWFRTTYQPVYAEENKVVSVQMISQDITEIKKAQEEIIAARNKALENEKKLKEYQSMARLGGWELDLEKGIFTFNDNFYNIFHTNIEEIGSYYMTPGDYASKFVHPEDAWMVEDEIRKALETSDPDFSNYLEHRIRYMNGGIGYIGVRFFIVKDNAGKTVKIYGVNQDITERKKSEKELIEAKEKAEESDRLKTAFIQNLSHEIRTPMNAIMGFAELMGLNYGNREKLEKYSTIINHRSNDLLRIIDDLLDVARIESGQVSVVTETFWLHPLFMELKETFEIIYDNKLKHAVNFRCYIPEGLLHSKIKTDKQRFKQIITNLLNNSFKFTEKGTIEFGCTLDHNHKTVFYVSDTGIGIPENKLSSIFNRFTQLHDESRMAYGGNGLGLFIVKELLKLLNGKIWVDSTPGKGTTFFFCIGK